VETMIFSTSIRAGGTSVTGLPETYEADERHVLDNQVDAGDTLVEALTVDASTPGVLEAFQIYADKEVTVTPFDGLSANGDGPFTIPAKKAVWWNTGRVEACPFTADFDSLHIHNAGADAANVKLWFLVHAAS
jgi:hypothetical protein